MKAYHVYIMRTEAVSPISRLQLHAGCGTGLITLAVGH